MIKLNGNRRTVRETTAEFQYTDDEGNLKFDEIRVRYFSPRIEDFKKLRAEFEAQAKANNGQPFFLSEGLAKQIESLPDLADAKGKPLKITAEVLLAPNSKPGEELTGTIRSARKTRGHAANAARRRPATWC
jgi:hypothetical protein